MKYCEARDCNEVTRAKKYCNKHQLTDSQNGIPNKLTKAAKGSWDDIMCLAKDCERDAYVRGVCRMHYVKDLRLDLKGIPMKDEV